MSSPAGPRRRGRPGRPLVVPVAPGSEAQRRRCLDVAAQLQILAFTESDQVFLEREAAFWQQWWSWTPPSTLGGWCLRTSGDARPVAGRHRHEGDRQRYLGLARRMEALALMEAAATFEQSEESVWRDLMQLGVGRGVVEAPGEGGHTTVPTGGQGAV
jgi:hypothetical protein